jgi:hypothetical protein
MMLLPLYLRMWLYFLVLREDTFTEKDMTRDELILLKEYVVNKNNKVMHYSFGWVDYEDGIVTDTYDFHLRVWGFNENILCNISYYYQKVFRYTGYKIRIDLNTLPE